MDGIKFRRLKEKEADKVREMLTSAASNVRQILRTERKLRLVFKSACVWNPECSLRSGTAVDLLRLPYKRWEEFCLHAGFLPRPKPKFRDKSEHFQLYLPHKQPKKGKRQASVKFTDPDGERSAATEETKRPSGLSLLSVEENSAARQKDPRRLSETLVRSEEGESGSEASPANSDYPWSSFRTTADSDEETSDSANSPSESLADIQRVESFSEKFALQRTMDQEEVNCEHLPTWAPVETVPQLGRFDSNLKLGTGLAKRKAMSSRALQNLVMALEPTGPKKQRSVSLMSEADVRDMFKFIAYEEKSVNYDDFLVLLMLLVERRFHDTFDEDAHKATQDFIRDYLDGYIDSIIPPSVPQLVGQGPLRRYPGVEEVYGHVEGALKKVFDIRIDRGDEDSSEGLLRGEFLQLMDEMGALRFPNMSKTEVLSFFTIATKTTTRTEEEEEEVPVRMMFREFGDAIILVSYYIFSIEPHYSNLPTLSQRFFVFVMSWSSWFQEHLHIAMQDELLPLEPDRPEITSIVPMKVELRRAENIKVFGERFPTRGVFFRFGNFVTVSSVLNPFEHSVIVPVPPVDPDRIVVRLMPQDDEDLHFCVVREKHVAVALSVDGNAFLEPFHEKFIYEDASPVFSLKPYQGKIQRVFNNYTTYNDHANTSTLGIEQWKKFLSDFKLQDPYLETRDSTEEGDRLQRSQFALRSFNERVAANLDEYDPEADGSYDLDNKDCFETYAALHTKSTASGLGSKSSNIPRTLNFMGFLKGLIRMYSKRDIDPNDGLKSLLESDAWLGRTLLSDVPTTHRGQFSLRVRRAANSFNIVKMLERVEHNNSPRGGLDPLIEGADTGENPTKAVPVLWDWPLGRWSNEARHQRMILDFMMKGEEEQNSLLLQRYKEATESGGTVKAPGRKMDDSSLAVLQKIMPKKAPVLDGSALSAANRSPQTSSLAPTPASSVRQQASFFGLEPTPTSKQQQLPQKKRVSVGGGTGFVRSESALFSKDEMIDPKEMMRAQTKQIMVHAQREEYARVMRREKDSDDHHQREVVRLRQQLAEKENKNLELFEQLSSTKKEYVADLTGSAKGVLQAEKEELQRIFVYELERKRHQMAAEQAQEENMRDMERDRVVGELRERLQHQDHMYKRLQELVRTQTSTLEQQTQVLDMLKKRVGLFKVDGDFFRDTHDQLVNAVDKGKHRELISSIESQRVEHDTTMAVVATAMAKEAKREAKKVPTNPKELLPPSRVAAFPEDELSSSSTTPQDAGFALPEVEKPIMTYTEEELQAKVGIALHEEELRNQKLVDNLKQHLNVLTDAHQEELELVRAQLAEAQEAAATAQTYYDANGDRTQEGGSYYAEGDEEGQSYVIEGEGGDALPPEAPLDVDTTAEAEETVEYTEAEQDVYEGEGGGEVVFDETGTSATSWRDQVEGEVPGGRSPRSTPSSPGRRPRSREEEEAMIAAGIVPEALQQFDGTLTSLGGESTVDRESESGVEGLVTVVEAADVVLTTVEGEERSLVSVPASPRSEESSSAQLSRGPGTPASVAGKTTSIISVPGTPPKKPTSPQQVVSKAARIPTPGTPGIPPSPAAVSPKSPGAVSPKSPGAVPPKTPAGKKAPPSPAVSPKALTRIVYKMPPPKPTLTSGAQTDTPRVKRAPLQPSVVDEYAKFFGRTLDILWHSVQPTDTPGKIAAMYEVDLMSFLRSNFLIPPSDSEHVTAAQMGEANKAMHGIPAKRVRVPVPLGTKAHYEVLGQMRGAVRSADLPVTPESAPLSLSQFTGGDQLDQELEAQTASVSPQIRDLAELSATERQNLEDEDSEASDEAVRYDDDSEDEETRARRKADAQEKHKLEQEVAAMKLRQLEDKKNYKARLIQASSTAKTIRQDLQDMKHAIVGIPTTLMAELSEKMFHSMDKIRQLGESASPRSRQKRNLQTSNIQIEFDSAFVQKAKRIASSFPGGPLEWKDGAWVAGARKEEEVIAGHCAAPGFHPGQIFMTRGRTSPPPQTLSTSGLDPRSMLLTTEIPSANLQLTTTGAGPRMERAPLASPELLAAITPPRAPSSIGEPIDITQLTSLFVTPVATHALSPGVIPAAGEKGGKRYVNALIMDDDAKTLLSKEEVARCQVVIEAEKVFQYLLLQHDHALSKSHQKEHRAFIKAHRDEENRKNIAVNGEEVSKRHLKLNQRQEEERNNQEAARRRREENEKSRKESERLRQAQLESKAAIAVRQKRMIQEHLSMKKMPTKVQFIPKLLQQQMARQVVPTSDSHVTLPPIDKPRRSSAVSKQSVASNGSSPTRRKSVSSITSASTPPPGRSTLPAHHTLSHSSPGPTLATTEAILQKRREMQQQATLELEKQKLAAEKRAKHDLSADLVPKMIGRR